MRMQQSPLGRLECVTPRPIHVQTALLACADLICMRRTGCPTKMSGTAHLQGKRQTLVADTDNPRSA